MAVYAVIDDIDNIEDIATAVCSVIGMFVLWGMLPDFQYCLSLLHCYGNDYLGILTVMIILELLWSWSSY